MSFPPLAFVFKLERGSFDLKLIGMSTTAHKGVVRVPLVRDMENGTRKEVGNSMVPSQIGKHTVARTVIVYAEVVQSII